MYTENYFEKTFSDMNTVSIGYWLHEAQLQIPHYSGGARLILLEGIRTAASELLIRYREQVSK